MPIPILVASVHPAFGELIRLSLEKSSAYQVKLVRTGTEIFTAVNRERFDIAIIDADIQDQPFTPMIQNLLTRYPAMRIVIIPPAGEAKNLSIVNLEVDGFLQKPFYLPDLLQLVDRLLQTPSVRNEKIGEGFRDHLDIDQPIAPDWLKNREAIEGNLCREVQKTSAYAVFILKENEIWAKAGKIEISVLNELTMKFKGFYETPTQLHRLRFIRLDSLGKDILHYLITLIPGYSLGAVYNFDTPLMVIRQEIVQLANDISSQPIFESQPLIMDSRDNHLKNSKENEITPERLVENPAWVKETFPAKKTTPLTREDPILGKTRPLDPEKDLGLRK